MRVVAQRVTQANVSVKGHVVGEIGDGLLLLVGAGQNDSERDVDWMAHKIANLRVFEDGDGKMNRSLLDTGGAVLAVSQFTLHGDCRKGNRPSFVAAMRPERARELFDLFVKRLGEKGVQPVETGEFGAMMAVELLNDGPVTLLLDSEKTF